MGIFQADSCQLTVFVFYHLNMRLMFGNTKHAAVAGHRWVIEKAFSVALPVVSSQITRKVFHIP